jgi:Rrf2 family iron-sulfur cluster assembly transcriptional regulator
MRLTRAGEYAVRCALYLAMQPDDGEISRRQVSQAMEVPLHFLGKIAQQLSHAGIIQITKGAKGGYRLARPAKHINLLEVVEAVEGPLGLNLCLIHEESCDRSGFCPVHEVWQEAQAGLQKTLAKADLATLAAEEKQRQSRIS